MSPDNVSPISPDRTNGGRRLLWDSASLRITNDARANSLLHYPYRDGWTL
jgi:hypothetical protein